MTYIGDIMAPLGATVLGTRSLADAAQILERADQAVVLNLSYRAIGLITREDLRLLQQRDPDGWAKKRCACLVPQTDQPVQRSTAVRELLVSSAHDPTRPLLVLDRDEPVGILFPESISAWRDADQPIKGDPMKGSIQSPMKSSVR